MFNKFKFIMLGFAEVVDAWRIIPRLVVAGYCYWLWDVYQWFKTIKTTPLMSCIFEEGKKICNTTGLDGPSTQQAAVITAIIGLSAAIFGFYTNTSKKWENFPSLKKNQISTVLTETKTSEKSKTIDVEDV